MMDWHDVESKLQERARDVAAHLLPNGKLEGGEWCCGDVDGNKGRSLKVNVTGKPGLWRDFAGHDGGKTLLGLWCKVRAKGEFRVAIREAKDFLGLRDDFDQRIKTYAPPGDASKRPDVGGQAVAEEWAKTQPLTEGGPVWRYLVDERQLDSQVLALYQVREVVSKGHWVMVFPYFAPPEAEKIEVQLNAAPVPEWLKFEALERVEGKKREWTTRGPEKTLWGAHLSEHAAFRTARHVLLCEGEKDALTWASYGCAEWGVLPVSVPFGAKWRGLDKGKPSPNREWLDRCVPWLAEFETVLVALDMDVAGKRAAADIIAEIGPRRCRLVELPHKDANDCRKAGVPRERMQAALDQARDFAPEKVKRAAEFEDAFYAEWFDKELNSGLELPFAFPFKFRLAELTIWTGIEKSGKTTLLDFCQVHLMHQGERVLIASFETAVPKTLKKLSRQAWGDLIRDPQTEDRCATDDERLSYRNACREHARETFQWLAYRLWLYDHVGIAHWRQVLEDMRWARRRFGITQFVLDNFMRLGISKDDYAQQADAVTALAAFSMEIDAHIHLVVHQNKSEGQKGGSGGKRSVAGAFEIIANAHNIVEVQRDVTKGEKISELWEKRKSGLVTDAEFAAEKNALDKKPDGKFVLHAQREGETQNGSKYLWFLHKSQQFVDVPPGHEHYKPLRYVALARKAPAQDEPNLPGPEDIPPART